MMETYREAGRVTRDAYESDGASPLLRFSARFTRHASRVTTSFAPL
jgi:hypothetical protein